MTTWVVSPDGATVYFVGDVEQEGIHGLYRADAAGGAATPIVPGEPGGLAPFDLAVTPDGSRVLYRQSDSGPYDWDLYSVPAGGGTPTLLSGATAEQVYDYAIDPAGTRVVFRASSEPLHSVAIDGGPAVPLGTAPLSGLGPYAFTADGSHVVLLGDLDALSVYELYAVPTLGGATVKLNAPLVAGGQIGEFKVEPVHDQVVYEADAEVDGRVELYRVDVDGTDHEKISAPQVAGGSVLDFDFFDGDDVAYSAWQNTVGVRELFHVRSINGNVEPINGPLDPGSAGVTDWAVTPDGTAVVYVAPEDHPTNPDYYMYEGGVDDRRKLYGPPFDGATIDRFDVAPDGLQSTIVMRLTDGSAVFLAVPLDGRPVENLEQIDDALDPPEIEGVWFSQDGAIVAYGGTDGFGSPFLSAIPTDGEVSTPQRIARDELDLGWISDPAQAPPALTPDGAWLVFPRWETQRPDPQAGIWSAAIDADLDGRAAECDVCPEVRDSAQSDTDGDGVGNACDTCAGIANPDQRRGILTSAGGLVTQHLLSPDGLHAVWLESGSLRAAPLDGGSPVALHPPLVAGGEIDWPPAVGFAESGGGDARVVFLADAEVDERDELFTVPIGGSAPTKLDPALQADEDVVGFALSADRTLVTWLAFRGGAPPEYRLSVAPVAGPGPGGPTVLTTQPVFGPFFELTPDGSRVVYIGRTPDQALQVYSVPVAGAPRRCSTRRSRCRRTSTVSRSRRTARAWSIA